MLSTASPLVAISQAVRSKQFLPGCAGLTEEVVASSAVFKGAPLLRRKEGCAASMGATRRNPATLKAVTREPTCGACVVSTADIGDAAWKAAIRQLRQVGCVWLTVGELPGIRQERNADRVWRSFELKNDNCRCVVLLCWSFLYKKQLRRCHCSLCPHY